MTNSRLRPKEERRGVLGKERSVPSLPGRQTVDVIRIRHPPHAIGKSDRSLRSALFLILLDLYILKKRIRNQIEPPGLSN